jgi:hypothetical protein
MKTDRPHEEIEELIAADALDGLEPADRERLFREMASHGPDCPDCRSLLDEYQEVAGWLALALPPAPMSAEAEKRLLQAARGESVEEPDTETVRVLGAPTAPARARRWIAAAAVAAAVALVAGALGWVLAPRGQGVSAQGQFIAFVGQPGTRVITLAAGPGRTLAVAYRFGEQAAWIVGNGIPDPAGDRVYELWYRAGNGDMQPAGTFRPTDGTVVAKVDVGAAFDTLAVSVEPKGGSEHPTTQPIYLVSV